MTDTQHDAIVARIEARLDETASVNQGLRSELHRVYNETYVLEQAREQLELRVEKLEESRR